MGGVTTIASGVGLVAIVCAIVLSSLADALQQNSREMVTPMGQGVTGHENQSRMRPRKIAAEGTPLSVSGNGLQSSGEEDDDSVSVDLVDEIPSEVGVSESVSPDQDLP